MKNGKRILVVGFGLLLLTLMIAGCSRMSGAAGGDFAGNTASRESAPVAQGGSTGSGGESFPSDDGSMGYDAVAEEEVAPGEPPMVDADMANSPATGSNQEQIQRLIVNTGAVNIAVENTRDAEREITQHVNSMAPQGAFVVSSSIYGGSTDDSPYISMSIRVPAEKFAETMNFLTDLAAEGTTPTSSQSAQDVTEEYVDLASRLESLEAARDRLKEIMENSQTTEELLQAEALLTQREAEIESIKGRMKYLEQTAALSEITIELQPYFLSQPVDTRWRPAETIREAFETLLDSLTGLGDFLIYLVIAAGPYLLIFGLILYLLFRFIRSQIRKSRERRAAAQAATAVSTQP